MRTSHTGVWRTLSACLLLALALSAVPAHPSVTVSGGGGAAVSTTCPGSQYVTAIAPNGAATCASAMSLTATAQVFSGGVRVTSYSLGTISSFTADSGNGPLQYGTNNGAFTLTAPANDGSLDILVTNGASAGAITFSGFTVGSSTGDALTTTNGNKFVISIRRINAVSTYLVKALQ